MAGQLEITISSALAFAAGPVTIAHLEAQVPFADENYGQLRLLKIENVVVNAFDFARLPVMTDSAVHLASFFGDVSGNRRIDAIDAARTAMFAAQQLAGFRASGLVDPNTIGDISGNGRINAVDASLVARFAALIPVPQIPLLPTATLPSRAIRFDSPMALPARDQESVGSADAPAEASIDDYWGNATLWHRAAKVVAAEGWPTEDLMRDDSGTLEDAVDEFFADLSELVQDSLSA